MLGTELAVPADALTTVALVLAEAIALYVLYGALTAAIGRKLLVAVGGE